MKFYLLLLFLCLSIISYGQQPQISEGLKQAIQNDDIDALVKALNPDEINACFGKYSLLVLSIKVNAANTLKYLIDKGADLENTCDKKSPIIHAAQDGKLDYLKLLVEGGADIQHEYKGKTALDYAIALGNEDIVEYFKEEKGFDLFSLDGVDGPYIVDDMIFTISSNNEITKEELSHDKAVTVRVNNEDQDEFAVQIKKSYDTNKGIHDMPNKLIAISDIEGNFDGLYSFLLNNGVMDKDYNWTFGDGHLVLGGDFMDRGDQVTQVLWLLYSLEEKAEAAGGKVHFILGNHEVMNLQGDTRYVNNKYLSAAQKISNNGNWEEAYLNLFSQDSELGKWMRSKNAVEKIGDYLFVHAGISPELLDHKLSIPKINHLIRRNIDTDLYNNPTEDERIMFLMSSKGPLWYRGYVTKYKYYEKAIPKQVNEVLDYYQVKKVVIGHTLAEDITAIQDDQVIMIDVHHGHKKNSGKSKGLLIENGVEYKVNDKGEKKKL